VLVLVGLVVWFANLDYRRLIKFDEGRYAEISREMAVSGDWVTPRLNGIKYFEKPPLHYWAGATAIILFGQHQWVARLWSALAGVLSIALAWYAGRRLFGPAAGLYAAVVLASSLMYVVVGHLDTLDMGLTLFLFVVLCSLLLALRDGANTRENAMWMHSAWAAMAGAVLTKGLVGVVIPGATLVLYTLMRADRRPWLHLHLVTGLLLFLAITGPWFLVVSMRNPEFAWFFFVHEHFLRYTTTIHHRVGPWYYFVAILVVGWLPWTMVVADAAWRSWKAQPGATFQVRRFLLIWCGFVLLFFSASGSKLPSYILPLFPAAALVAGWRLSVVTGDKLTWQFVPTILLGLIALVALPFITTSGDTPVRLIQAFKPWIAAAALVAVAAAAYAAWISRRGNVQRAVLVTGLAGLVGIQLIITGHESLSPSGSAYATAQQVKPYLKAGIPFYSVGTYDHTLDFYLGRTVTLVQYRDEMDFGLQQDPQLAIPTVAEWMEIWKRQRYALALVERVTYEQLRAVGFPMELIANDQSRYYIKTPRAWESDASGSAAPALVKDVS
jgi:4-amino-4-deoxy-L-arabinose transferase-like glycosyltransferase